MTGFCSRVNAAVAGIGVGLAVPITITTTTREVLTALLHTGRVRRAWLGIVVELAGQPVVTTTAVQQLMVEDTIGKPIAMGESAPWSTPSRCPGSSPTAEPAARRLHRTEHTGSSVWRMPRPCPAGTME